jgi:site-specific recombinase XerD
MLHSHTLTSAAGDSETPQVANQLLISMAGTSPPAPLLVLGQLDAEFATYLDYAANVKGHSDATLHWYRGAYSNYRRYLLAAAVASDAFAQRAFDLDGWIRWNHQRHLESITMNGYWRALRAFFNDWERRGGPNPFRGARAPKVRSYVPKALAHDDCVRIMLTAGSYPWRSPFERALALALLGVMLYAGLRLGEVRRLRLEDVDLREGTIRVVRGKGQGGGKDRTAYVAPELVAMLREYLAERYRRTDGRQPPEFFMTAVKGVPVGIITIRDIVRRVSTACGIAFSSHVLRHSFVTHLIRSGAPIHVVRDLAGHANISTTMGYLNVFDEDRRATLQKLQFIGTSTPQRGRRRAA